MMRIAAIKDIISHERGIGGTKSIKRIANVIYDIKQKISVRFFFILLLSIRIFI
jgi:hypothetical protein